MEQQVIAEEKTYRLSRAGRRTAYLLLAGGVIIWLFALWMLKSTLRISLSNFWASIKDLGKWIIGAEGAPAFGPEELIPAAIMLVLVVVVPLLIWNILEELKSSYTVGPAGFTFRSLWGIALTYPWTEVTALRPVDAESEAPLDELVMRTSHLASIRSALVRFLHWQAYGRHKLPLYGGLEEREELIGRIRGSMAAVEAAPPAAGEDAVVAAADEEGIAPVEELPAATTGEPAAEQPEETASPAETTPGPETP